VTPAAALASLVFIPDVAAGVQIAHDLGVDGRIRGSIDMAADVKVVQCDGWHADFFLGARTWVRQNIPGLETIFRVSPDQVHYPVGGRLRFELSGGSEWGLFVAHQSNHDIDSVDPVLARETISYEVYGADWVTRHLGVSAGVLVDRGTTRSGTWQEPFDYYIAQASVRGSTRLDGPAYAAAVLDVAAHADGEHDPPWLNLAGHAEVGLVRPGPAGTLRLFLRLQRLEDYRWLGDPARHLLLLGVGLGSPLEWTSLVRPKQAQ